MKTKYFFLVEEKFQGWRVEILYLGSSVPRNCDLLILNLRVNLARKFSLRLGFYGVVGQFSDVATCVHTAKFVVNYTMQMLPSAQLVFQHNMRMNDPLVISNLLYYYTVFNRGENN